MYSEQVATNIKDLDTNSELIGTYLLTSHWLNGPIKANLNSNSLRNDKK